MGCAPSKRGSDEKSLQGSRDSRDFEAERISAMVLMANPIVEVTIGSGIAREPDFMHTVLFVFGGPGSQKGVLTQELAHEFDFTLINIEDIVFSYLPNKVANTVADISEIQEMLRRDSGVLTLEWILSMISAKLSTSSNQRFIIDIVPELTSILRSETYRTGDHDKKLEHFERRHPVFFAMELFVSGEEKMYEAQNENDSARNELNTKELSPELTAFVRGIDEADKGRLEKRILNYHKCARPFLKYFNKTKRVVRFDLKVPHNPEILYAVRKTLTDFGFAKNNDFIRVVLFVPREKNVTDIDLDYYRLRKVYLSDICHDREETLSQQIRAVRKFIYRTAKENENYLVILNCLNNTDYPLTKKINFSEVKDTYLDYFIRHREQRVPAQRCKMAFRAISTTTAELCLFPKSMGEQLCNKIGFIFGEKLTFSESNSRANSRAPSAMSTNPLDSLQPD
uniref:Adenylate kinase n=1 Tax=Panagrolaimus superbus TaxID=310955 RepID=A0A914Z416_9BILA